MKSNEPLLYEWNDSIPPSVSVVEALADATGRDPLSMPQLYDYVDIDAMDALVTARKKGTGTVTASFTYDDSTIQLGSDGRIEIWPAEASHG